MTGAKPHRISPGSLLYWCFYRPKRWLQDRRDQAAGRRGDEAMRAAAAVLPPLSLPDWGLAGPPCRFLTGARFIHQTIFCARSFEWACGTHVRLEIFGDGSLDPAHLATLRRALPHAAFADDNETAARLDRILPVERFPVLRGMRASQPLMRKLLDLHAGFAGPALYLDSDMLFFSTPVILRNWLRVPAGALFMQQRDDALVDRREQLERTLHQAILAGVNTGIVAVDDRSFDWTALEGIAAQLTRAERAHPWAEQTLFALHLSRCHAAPLSPSDYVLCYNRRDLARTRPPLRHYVHKSKALYAAHEWRLWLECSRVPPSNQV